jgi:hypothetical protein
MFPPGFPGLALVLLRISVAIAALLASHSLQGLSSWSVAAVFIVCAALSAGFLTPIVAILALVFDGLAWTNIGPGTSAAACLNALALALLGPGAYSVDAYRFGRRVVVLPPP